MAAADPSPGPGWVVLRRAALDLVVPQHCAGCGAPGTAWCAACRGAVAGPVRAVPGPVPVCAAAPHRGPAGRAVHAFKDEAARGLARPLAGLLAAAVLGVLRAPVGRAAEQAAGRAADPLRMPRSGGRQGVAPVWLVPVPARRAARRARGSDHMRELARLAARQLRHAGVPAHRLDLLAHVAASRDQVGLGRAERRANVTGTLAARGPVPAGLLVVVDDVTTTGATLAEAVRALRASAPGRPVRAAAITWAGPPAHPAAGLASPAGHD